MSKIKVKVNTEPIASKVYLHGPQGAPGISAYQSAVNNGFIGTEQQWLASLKGKAFIYDDFTAEQLSALKGPKGDTGPRGLKGDKGDKGDAFTFSDFTPSQLESLRGPQGERGETGPQGIQGLSGKDGVDGKTPILGMDYFTEIDKQEIVNSVLASLVDGDKEVY